MPKYTNYSLLLISVFFLLGCFQEPKIVEIKNVNILDSKNEMLNAEMVSTIQNPNKISIPIDSFRYNIKYENQNIGKGKSESSVVIKKSSLTDVPQKVKISLKKMLNTIQGKNIPEQLPLVINMEIFIDAPIKKINKKIIHTLSIKDLLSGDAAKTILEKSVKIKNIKIIPANMQQTKVMLDIEYNNRLPVGFEILNTHINIYSDKNHSNKVSYWSSDKVITVQSEAINSIPAKFNVDNRNAAAGLFGKFFSRDLNYYLKGHAEIKIFDKTIELPINQKISMAP